MAVYFGDWGKSFLGGREAVRQDQSQDLQLKRETNATARDTNSLIAQYAANADTPEKWAQAMGDLQRAGVGDASQFANRFDLRDTIIQRAYSAADQMNSRTAGEFLGSLGAGTLSSLPLGAQQGATLDPTYLASLPPVGAAPPVGGIPSRPNTAAPKVNFIPGPSLSDNIAALRPAMAVPGLAAALGGNGMPAPLPGPMNRLPTTSAPPAPMAGASGANAMTGGAGMDVLGDTKLPPSLIMAESGGRQFGSNGQPLTSPAGAVGVAQVMPGTAPEAARMAGVPFDENRYRNDPAYNEQLGAAYYDAQMRKYGDPALAAAAYNAGPGAVDDWLAGRRASLPAETVAYVRRVTGRDLGASAATGSVRPGTRDIQAPVPNGVPLSSLQILARNPTYAGTAIEAAMNQYGQHKPIEVNGRLIDPQTFQVLADFSKNTQAVDLTPEQTRALGFPPGTVVQRKADNTLEVVQKAPETGGGPFSGNSLDAQDSNILLRGDPASPEYALAYQRQFMTPKLVQIPDPNNPGAMMTATVIVSPPPGIKPPAGIAPQAAPQQQPSAPQATQGASQAPQQSGAVSLQPIPGTSKPLVPTEQQRLDASFADRMAASNSILDQTEGAAADFTERAKAGVPGVGNYMVSPQFQQFDQARRDFVNAQLRRESGAAISQSEFDNAERQYFPQPGDGPQVIAQKRAARQRAVENMRMQSGPAFNQQNPDAARPQQPPAQTVPQSDLPRIQSDDDYNKLPSKTRFIAPDGTVREKP